MGTSKTKGAHEMKRFARSQNQSNRTDAAACAPACSYAHMGSDAIAMIMDAAILAVSIFVCLSVDLTVLVWLAALIVVLAVRIMNQLNTAESRNAFVRSVQHRAA